MLKTIDQTREFYQSIPKNAQAYIQMSDSQEILFFQNDTLLPSWELLHNGKNFILEACFLMENILWLYAIIIKVL